MNSRRRPQSPRGRSRILASYSTCMTLCKSIHLMIAGGKGTCEEEVCPSTGNPRCTYTTAHSAGQSTSSLYLLQRVQTYEFVTSISNVPSRAVPTFASSRKLDTVQRRGVLMRERFGYNNISRRKVSSIKPSRLLMMAASSLVVVVPFHMLNRRAVPLLDFATRRPLFALSRPGPDDRFPRLHQNTKIVPLRPLPHHLPLPLFPVPGLAFPALLPTPLQ